MGIEEDMSNIEKLRKKMFKREETGWKAINAKLKKILEGK